MGIHARNYVRILSPLLLKAISKTEKWFEIKPTAPVPTRRDYRPEGWAYALPDKMRKMVSFEEEPHLC
jgi:hypothetical protein